MAHRHLDNLNLRLATTNDVRDLIPLANAIEAHKARMAELPAILPEEVRDEITMWEGQLVVHGQRFGAERDLDDIRKLIAFLMAPAMQVTAGTSARVDKTSEVLDVVAVDGGRAWCRDDAGNHVEHPVEHLVPAAAERMVA